MHTYLKTKDGKIYIIWGGGVNGTYDCYPASESFDPNCPSNIVSINQDDVACIDSNLAILNILP